MKEEKKMTDAEIKIKLLEMARSGEPKPKANSKLGRALKKFTTKTKED